MKNRKTLKHILTIMIFMMLLITVSACGGGGGGGGSTPTPEPPVPVTTPPSAVTNLTVADGDTYGVIVLKWTTPSHGSSALQAYDVRYSTASTIDESGFLQLSQVNFSAAITPKAAGIQETAQIIATGAGAMINSSIAKPGSGLFWCVRSQNSTDYSAISNVTTPSIKVPWRAKIKISLKNSPADYYETYFGVQGNAADNAYDSKVGFDAKLPPDAATKNIYAYFGEKASEQLTSSMHSAITKQWQLIVTGLALAPGTPITLEFPDYSTAGPVFDRIVLDEATSGSSGANVNLEIPSAASTANYVIGNDGRAVFNIYGQ